MGRMELAHTHYYTNKYLLYSTGRSAQCSNLYGGKKGMDICMYIADSLHCKPEANTTFKINYTPIKFF